MDFSEVPTWELANQLSTRLNQISVRGIHIKAEDILRRSCRAEIEFYLIIIMEGVTGVKRNYEGTIRTSSRSIL